MEINDTPGMPLPTSSQYRIGLSNSAEQRWRQMMGVASQSPLVLPTSLSLSHRLGYSSPRRRSLDSEDEEQAPHSFQAPHQVASVSYLEQRRGYQFAGGSSSSSRVRFQAGDDETAPDFRSSDDDDDDDEDEEEMYSSAGTRRTVRVAQVRSPPSFGSPASFVPPDGEEWHLLDGYYVRMSRAELDEVLARAEASDSEADMISLADTSVGPDSDEDDELAEDSEASF
eukprot:TRINITY_DN3295_c0_g1_i1.p1 TRINITY_DN3295_c0_g1~~TRINITY_DN3295_c0_g1_i1.p1  ORF type:complete len:252 (-),score=19.89 TRINITY_DN3295_c0_g1_i1:242-922(-)